MVDVHKKASNMQRDMPITIEAIFMAEFGSGDMQSLDQATLLQGVGLEGDRYARRVGTYSVLRASKRNPGQPEPGRQLTLISADGVESSMKEAGIEWIKSLGDLRRNIVLRNISAEDLLKLIGSTLQLGKGGAKVFLHRNCVPCMYNERKNETPGLMEALWNAGGVSCEVVGTGAINVGDEVQRLPDGDGEIDEGFRPSGFFVRPSKRSAAMVKEALEGKKRTHRELLAIDPEGVSRAQQSYQSVGLKFWPAV